MKSIFKISVISIRTIKNHLLACQSILQGHTSQVSVPTCRVRSRSRPIADIAISTWSMIRSDSLSVFTCSHSAMSFTTKKTQQRRMLQQKTQFLHRLCNFDVTLICHHCYFESSFVRSIKCFFFFSPGQTQGRHLRSSSTCSCRSAPLSTACWAPAPTCVGSSIHNLQRK